MWLEKPAKHIEDEHIKEDVPDAARVVEKLISNQPPELQRPLRRRGVKLEPLVNEDPDRPEKDRDKKNSNVDYHKANNHRGRFRHANALVAVV